jgi:hypothetical protein
MATPGRAGFSAALQADREEIHDVIATHPEQTPRLRRWLETLEALGRYRDGDPACSHCSTGDYYELLSALGYTYSETRTRHDEGADGHAAIVVSACTAVAASTPYGLQRYRGLLVLGADVEYDGRQPVEERPMLEGSRMLAHSRQGERETRDV